MINMGELFANDRIGDIDMELVPMNDKEIATMLVEPGDLLFARQSLVLAGAGRCSIIAKADEPTTFESHIIRVRLKRKNANPVFFYYYFKSPICRIRSIVIQGVQAGIRGNDLKKLKVHVPSISEQQRIASILSAYDDLIGEQPAADSASGGVGAAALRRVVRLPPLPRLRTRQNQRRRAGGVGEEAVLRAGDLSKWLRVQARTFRQCGVTNRQNSRTARWPDSQNTDEHWRAYSKEVPARQR
jgi:hypothetical protein